MKDINPLLDARFSLEKQFAASEQPRLQKTGLPPHHPSHQPTDSFNFNEFEFYYIQHILHYKSHVDMYVCARVHLFLCHNSSRFLFAAALRSSTFSLLLSIVFLDS